MADNAPSVTNKIYKKTKVVHSVTDKIYIKKEFIQIELVKIQLLLKVN